MYAVSIGDIGNEVFSESSRGARSLQVEREGACAFELDPFFVHLRSAPRFRPIAPPPLGIMSPFDSTARKQAPEPASAYRMAPHNIEAEQALLGAILVNNEALYRVSDFLEPFHFFEPIHQQIYDHARSLVRTGKLASPITLKTFLPADIDIAGLTVPQYLARLAAEATTIINAADYGRAIYDLAIRRDLIGIGEDMVNVAFDAPVDFAPRDQIEDAERRLYELAEIGRYGGGFQKFESALTTALEMAAHAYQRDGKLSGLATELKDLDSKLGGLQKSDLVIIAGRPGMGKTALATNIAYNIARSWRGEVRPDGHIETANGGIVGFFSLEMSAEQLATRIIAEQTGIPSSTIRRGGIDQRGFDKLKDVTVELQHLPLFIDETGGLSIAQLAARARRLKRQKGLDLLVIDYIQLLQGSTRRSQENRVQEVTEITTNLKALAKELNVPIVALSQLSRQVENRDDKRPQLSDLRESGSIEQDADVVMFVFREEYYLSNKEPRPGTDEHIKWQTEMDAAHGKAEIIIGKQRHGPTGTVNLQFDAAVTRFDNLARDDQAIEHH
jgi:replicative DNA helicase